MGGRPPERPGRLDTQFASSRSGQDWRRFLCRAEIGVMLLLHELHEVVGVREAEFEAANRDHYLPALASGDDARLLYFLHHAVGTGPAYNVVTITALRDGAAWDRLAERIEKGDLREWSVGLDDLRHDVRAKWLVPLPWSPLQSIDLEAIPADASEHELSVFMEDTVWPYEGGIEAYVEASGSHYAEEIGRREAEGAAMLEIQASFRTRFGSHLRREIVLWQKITSKRGLLGLLTTEVPERFKQPGLWMHDALEVRDRWQSKLLRTSAWSPWY